MKALSNTFVLLMFSALVGCSGGGGTGGGNAASGMNITVATGAPVAGASVIVVDANGLTETCASTTNSSGVINCVLSVAKTAPYFIKAQKGSTSLFAVMPEAGSNLNITPISDVMAKKYATENGSTPEQLISQPALMAASDKTKANDAVTLVNAIVRAIAAASGVTNVANPLTQSYTATSTDQMDKFIQNIQLNTDSSGINFSIPTATGTVAISVAYSASTTAATSAVTAKSAQLATASLTDGDKIEALMGVLLGKLPTCGNSAGQRADMVALINAVPNNGVNYMNGRTVEEWITRACSLHLPGMTKVFSKTLARFGNKVMFVMGAKPSDGSAGNLEMAWTAIKTGNAAFQASDTYGGWRVMADNMPVNFSIKTRHALNYSIDASPGGLTQIYYERYIDTWAGRTDGTVTDASKIPAKVEFYAVPLKDMADNYITGAAAASYFAGLSPTFTIYKTNTVGSNGTCASWFSLDQSKLNGDCEFFAKDDRSAAFTGLFTTLETNEYTLLIMQNKDSAGNCTNCENNMPTSFHILGKAYTVSQLFGSSVTKSTLTSGVSVSQFATAMDKARTFYAAPSTSELVSMDNKLRSTNVGSTLTVNWLRSNDKRPLDGIWGGWNSCGGGSWTELNQPDDATLLTTDSWAYLPPTGKTSFNQAGYLSFAFGNKINLTEFAFYVTANRGNICTQ